MRSKTKCDRAYIDRAKKLRLIIRGGVGLDNIDVDHARSKGIQVFNTDAIPPPPTFDAIRALRLVSRTFALSIEQLPSLLRDATAIAYLMFRVSDFLEDYAVMPPQRKVELLGLWVGVLDGEVEPERLTALLSDTDPGDPEAMVARHAGEVLRLLRRLPPDLQEHIRHEVTETSKGMARWQARCPVVITEDDLDDYMFEVAGRVGLMLTRLDRLDEAEARFRESLRCNPRFPQARYQLGTD